MKFWGGDVDGKVRSLRLNLSLSWPKLSSKPTSILVAVR